jgi:hypothetical protein
MSTVSRMSDSNRRPPEDDPYRYGWRYVPRVGPDGEETLEQVPLTLEDVLHPEEEDFIVQTDGHNEDCAYLKAVFKSRLADVPRSVVLSDCRVDFDVEGVRPLGPDVAVFFGVARHIDWSTFYLGEEGARPALVVEVTSPDTRHNDLGIKVDYYHRAGIPYYVIADVYREQDNDRRIELIGYEATPDGYVRYAPDDRGRIWLDPVRLWLGFTHDRRGGYLRLACFDPDTGEEVGDYEAVVDALVAAEAKAQESDRIAAEAVARANDLEAQLRALLAKRNGKSAEDSQ